MKRNKVTPQWDAMDRRYYDFINKDDGDNPYPGVNNLDEAAFDPEWEEASAARPRGIYERRYRPDEDYASYLSRYSEDAAAIATTAAAAAAAVAPPTTTTTTPALLSLSDLGNLISYLLTPLYHLLTLSPPTTTATTTTTLNPPTHHHPHHPPHPPHPPLPPTTSIALPPLLSPSTHLLTLLTALTLTLLHHRELARFTLYWLARLTSTDLAAYPSTSHLVPAALRGSSSDGGNRSRYWATLHALRWQEGLSGPAVRGLGQRYLGGVVVVGVLCPAGVGEAVLAGLGSVVWPWVQLYALVVVVTSGVRWAPRLLWFAREVAWFGVWAVMVAGREVLVLWVGVLRRFWVVLFASWAAWVSWRLVTQVDYVEVAAGTVVWFLYRSAGLLYWVSDMVRDMAGSVGLKA
ncbi:uncharacterized protein B0H64DRAFT_433632 [Chaetomium fimeti]|uniref:Uncharacterized protein n=1 Tax=Chaetomium fimeti TaxID=1854472 RepID=A0AAE0HDE5_9PEZI|nr:hypothetical protein B0H64DRAFT_433632 [Chaetomium fimeti]